MNLNIPYLYSGGFVDILYVNLNMSNHGNKTTLRDIIHEFLLSFEFKNNMVCTEMTYFNDEFSVVIFALCTGMLNVRSKVKFNIHVPISLL